MKKKIYLNLIIKKIKNKRDKMNIIDIISTIPGITVSETFVKRNIIENIKNNTKVKIKLKDIPFKSFVYILIPP